MADSTFTEAVLESYSPWASTDSTNYLSACAAMFELVYGVVIAQGDEDDPSTYVPSWSSLLDPDLCPTDFLPFLSQFNGTNVAPGTDDATARAQIKSERGFARGTVAAITTAAQMWLTGSKSVQVVERSPTPYHFQLVVRPEQVINVNSLTAEVNAVKPAGIQWTLIQTDQWTLGQLEADYPAAGSEATVESAFTTEAGFEAEVLGG